MVYSYILPSLGGSKGGRGGVAQLTECGTAGVDGGCRWSRGRDQAEEFFVCDQKEDTIINYDKPPNGRAPRYLGHH